MKKIISANVAFLLIVGLVLAIAMPALADGPDIPRYTTEEYNKMKMDEAEAYWAQLEGELKKWQDKAAEYTQMADEIQAEIDALKAEIAAVEAEVVKYELICLDKEIGQLEKMSYEDLVANEEKIAEYERRLKEIKGYNGADSPENSAKIAELEGRLVNLREGLKLPTTWTVKKGEYLYKIAGYEQIYNDPLKWPRIYRANRDLIKNPNLIYPGWVLKIPRGVVTSWTVYKGEYLYKIAGYEEVYQKGTDWTRIYEANKDQIKDPDLIYPKQTLTIPR